MITKENTYKKAFEIKNTALTQKLKNREMLLASAYSSNARLKEIDSELAAMGASLAITALSGDTEKIEKIKNQSLLNIFFTSFQPLFIEADFSLYS